MFFQPIIMHYDVSIFFFLNPSWPQTVLRKNNLNWFILVFKKKLIPKKSSQQNSPNHLNSCYTSSLHTDAGSPVPVMRPVPQAIEGASKVVETCMLFGGMDTEGVIFDDALLFLLPFDGSSSLGAAGN